MLQFLKRRKNKETFLRPIFMKPLGHALWRPSICAPSFAILHQMKDIIKLHNLDKFFNDSRFDSNFRDLQKLA